MIYVIRKRLHLLLPRGTILDDVYILLQVAGQRSRVVFDPKVVAWDNSTLSPTQEFRHKVRTLAGNYQFLQPATLLLTRSNMLCVQFVCHKLLRLLASSALPGGLVSTFWIRQSMDELTLVLQIVVYALATLTALPAKVGFMSWLSNISRTFIVLNSPGDVAFIYFITGREAVWAR